ncbi:hypothetical protein [Pseudomonas savastanoi]|uniref:hypothetical protein n=1 Tax=Pseudomonas savastanoi TaxID=29438 RepID=UPI000F0036F0|nr:hypothetical protein [Pseudomonas savastanoi]
MQAEEKRYPRDRFTKQLSRICKLLDELSVRDIVYESYGGTLTCHHEVTKLWVVGSYARGALTCGDLDIVMSFNASGAGLPLPNILSRAFFGSTPGVRFYSGTPELNRSGATFPDAVLIWSSEDSDWQVRMDSIQPDPAAGRAPRETDTVPLRAEQMRLPDCTLIDVARWQRSGILEWDYFSLDGALLAAVPPEETGRKEPLLFDFTSDMGRKTVELVPALWRVMRSAEPKGSWKRADAEKATLWCGSTLIHVGVPAMVIRHFESSKVRQLMLVPHRTARGPNGLWLIRRGPKHPHALGFKKCTGFYLGRVPAKTPVDPPEPTGSADSIVIFSLKSDADAALKNLPDASRSMQVMQVMQVKGFALYDLISLANVICHGDQQTVLTPAKQIANGRHSEFRCP